MLYRSKAKWMGAAALAVLAFAPAAYGAEPGQAQDKPGAESAGDTDIVVTARKREERLMDVPVTLTAVTERDIQAKGISNLGDVARFTPSLMISNNGDSRNDRSNQQITIRGMTPTYSRNVTVFLDGAPIAGSGFIDGVSDVARVEVIKGPQSAYFGRATFAGAVNIVTKDPGVDWKGTVDAKVGERNFFDIRGTVEGPLLGDALRFRLSGRDFRTDGSYANAAVPGTTLGDQSSRSVSLTLVSEPVAGLKIKATGLYWNDSDGPGATGKLSSTDYNCAAGAYATLNNYICGTLPKLASGRLAANTVIDSVVQNQLFNNASGRLKSVLPFDYSDHFGLERNAYHLGLNVDYEIPDTGIVFSSITGYDNQKMLLLQDIDIEDSRSIVNPSYNAASGTTQSYKNWLTGQSQTEQVFFQEARFSDNGRGALHWTAGVSYASSKRALGFYGVTEFGPLQFLSPSQNDTETYAGFGSLSYDIGRLLTVAVEGRYQRDKLSLYKLQPKLFQLASTTNNFTPRVLVQLKPAHDLMLYASYAKGVNPGGFNSGLITQDPAAVAQIQERYGASVLIKPERLTNYELGLKGQLFGGKMTVTAAVYHAIWSDQVLSNDISAVVNGLPTIINLRQNIGKSSFDGFEFETVIRPVRGLSLEGTFGYNKSKIKEYVCLTCATAVTGSRDVTGNSLYGTPKVNFSLGGEYSAPLVGSFDGFLRTDFTYQGPIFVDETNLSKIAAAKFVNMRAGIRNEGLLVEVFVTNLLNSTNYVNAARYVDVLRYFPDGNNANDFVVGLPEKRRIGLRVKKSF